MFSLKIGLRKFFYDAGAVLDISNGLNKLYKTIDHIRVPFSRRKISGLGRICVTNWFSRWCSSNILRCQLYERVCVL